MTTPDWTPEDEAMAEEVHRVRYEEDSHAGVSGIDSAIVRWHKARVAKLGAEIMKLLREVREWFCVDCQTVYPGPPQDGVKCVVCPKCGGRTTKYGGDTPMWKLRAEKAERENAALREEIEKLKNPKKPERVPGICALCKNPMPKGEEMFFYHGYSGNCPPAAKPDGEKK